jgi:hypothetical protein
MGRTSRVAAIGALAAFALGCAEQAALAGQAESGSVVGSGGVKRPVASRSRVRTENVGNPSITSDTGIMAFYRNNGIEMKGVIETRTAIATGDAVRAEVRRSLRR